MAALVEIVGEESGSGAISGISRRLEQVTPVFPVFIYSEILQTGQRQKPEHGGRSLSRQFPDRTGKDVVGTIPGFRLGTALCHFPDSADNPPVEKSFIRITIFPWREMKVSPISLNQYRLRAGR
ncbi:MAG: hypothetical protein OEM48_09780 [Gammaproteobacteria bacterium]|nr:hypothetical protein [Gammaproteobacteria bacterium]MDH3369849.1 hypothetical protein [Gammaproteobacteria bacterium]MDH3407191.1 hypothetical protein [Gammaproteobacteria bacterium]MDH3561845.1 hypothetical protein [Gammaproteobacteria bacterium]MDH5487917.1 hypothetical protein [Gammaproteobacteria bacterium]